jgi:hypothetical protein
MERRRKRPRESPMPRRRARSIMRSTHLENRSKDELYDEAKEIGIEGRSKMDKDALVDAIREN